MRSEPPKWDWETLIVDTMAAGMTYGEFWRRTPYEWHLQRKSFIRRMQMTEALVAWHAGAVNAPHVKGGHVGPMPFSGIDG